MNTVPQPKRSFEGIWIPAEIWLMPKKIISPILKIWLAEIKSLDHVERGCTASNSYFAYFFDCTESTASENINKLVNTGLVTAAYDESSHRTLKINRRLYADIIAGINPQTAIKNGEDTNETGGTEKPKGGYGKAEGGVRKKPNHIL